MDWSIWSKQTNIGGYLTGLRSVFAKILEFLTTQGKKDNF